MVKKNNGIIEIYEEKNKVFELVLSALMTLFFSVLCMIFSKTQILFINKLVYFIFFIGAFIYLIKSIIGLKKAPNLEIRLNKENMEIFLKRAKKGKIDYKNIIDIYTATNKLEMIIIQYKKANQEVKEVLNVTGIDKQELIKLVKEKIKK